MKVKITEDRDDALYNKSREVSGMDKKIKQFKAKEDDCIYFFDAGIGKYRKVCDIPSFYELPASIKKQILDAREEVEDFIKWPIK